MKSFLEVVDLFREVRHRTIPIEVVDYGEGKWEASFTTTTGGNKTIHLHGTNNDLTAIFLNHYVPDNTNAIVNEYGGYKERVVLLGKATQSLKLTYSEGSIINLRKETFKEQFDCQFEFETDERLKIISYEDCNGEYFDKDMTGEFIYPTLDYHIEEMLLTCLDTQKVVTSVTNMEDHLQHISEVGQYQEKSSNWKNPFRFDAAIDELKEQIVCSQKK